MLPEGGLSILSRLRGYVQERMTQLARDDRARATTHIAEGRPYEEIVRLAAQKDADLIVIGTNIHASLFGGAPVLGSEIERVVRNAPCPVLCVPASRVLTPLPAFVTATRPCRCDHFSFSFALKRQNGLYVLRTRVRLSISF